MRWGVVGFERGMERDAVPIFFGKGQSQRHAEGDNRISNFNLNWVVYQQDQTSEEC